nr:hypothetical protein BSM_13260 [uncultured archaeon]
MNEVLNFVLGIFTVVIQNKYFYSRENPFNLVVEQNKINY